MFIASHIAYGSIAWSRLFMVLDKLCNRCAMAIQTKLSTGNKCATTATGAKSNPGRWQFTRNVGGYRQYGAGQIKGTWATKEHMDMGLLYLQPMNKCRRSFCTI